jgi:hypothetical protein
MHGVSIFPENGNILQNSHISENKSIQVMFSFFFLSCTYFEPFSEYSQSKCEKVYDYKINRIK